MHCPLCGHDDDKVVDSRSADAGSAIRRRRECLKCGGRYTTYERVEGAPLVVRKRSGSLEPFNGAKLADGIRAAVGNGPVESATVDALVRSIEDDMAAQGSPVTSDEIGIAVLDRLRKLDPAAYLRFASVYKGFEAAEDFAREIRELAKVRKSDRDPQ
ncbi:MAG: transcriptional regulator NrdR [Acidimicrobiia bacterium]